MIKSLDWCTFVLWGLFDICIPVFSRTCLKETKGKTLEDISELKEVANCGSSAKALVNDDVGDISSRMTPVRVEARIVQTADRCSEIDR